MRWTIGILIALLAVVTLTCSIELGMYLVYDHLHLLDGSR